MAITGDDVTLDLIVPISHAFAIVEGELRTLTGLSHFATPVGVNASVWHGEARVSMSSELTLGLGEGVRELRADGWTRAVAGADTRVLVTDTEVDLELEIRLVMFAVLVSSVSSTIVSTGSTNMSPVSTVTPATSTGSDTTATQMMAGTTTGGTSMPGPTASAQSATSMNAPTTNSASGAPSTSNMGATQATSPAPSGNPSMASTGAPTTATGPNAPVTMATDSASSSAAPSVGISNWDSTMTTASSGNMTSPISCWTFTCNASTCYDVFLSQNASECGQNAPYCELKRWADMSYSVNCSTDCLSMSCANQTQSGFAPTTMTTTTTTTTTTAKTTTGKNGKKCHKLTCEGERCYKEDSQKGQMVMCLVGQDYCQLKKTVSGPVMTWTAGCSGNCMDETMCTSTAVDCTQECCNATATASCLKLDGSLNMPNSAPVGHPSPTLMLLGSALLVWLLCLQLHTE
ncbi:hypothetical protein JZ751_019529 [Albula glossodonta]|uniref:Uncharacterized protein n=1 Tax=Albula glossodonta TaxID=121402 RepID=A0A8T2N426_9TELE|nr:hypothetical protein JZ751_019529 [Albula glossodonta]